MSTWLHRIWISPAEHREIVDELRSRITRLEQDFVEVAQCLISETEARRRAEHVRNHLLRTRQPKGSHDDNVVALDTRRG